MNRGSTPAGLGARDTLRLEMGMPLYGHELTSDRNAAEAGFTKAISPDKEFIGSEVVCDVSKRSSTLVGLMLSDRRAAREGDRVETASGEIVGKVTSGSFAPSMGNAVALGYVDVRHAAAGEDLVVQTERHALPSTVVTTPFYRKATARTPMANFLDQED